jgi:hypothetical protein
MHAYLMRAPSVKLDFHKRGAVNRGQHAPVRARFARVAQHNAPPRGHPHAAPRIARNRQVNASGLLL